MVRWVIIILAIFSADVASAQPDSATIKKIASELLAVYTPAGDQLFFDPIAISNANCKILTDTTSATWRYVHPLKGSGKMEEALNRMMYLMPAANREFLSRYYLSDVTPENMALFNRVNKLTCNCVKDLDHDSEYYREVIKKCLENSPDTSTIAAYKTFIKAKLEANDINFLLDVIGHMYINCNKFYNELMTWVMARSLFVYAEYKTRYRAVILENCASYSAARKIDSLTMAFPQYRDFQQPLAEVVALYKQSGNTLSVRYEFIFQGNKFERYNALIVDPSNKKTHILGQAVIEIGTDRSKPYLKKINFYPRESIQNLARFEKQLDVYEEQKQSLLNPEF